jgi:protein dithiol:quinone oxidoreductase
MFWLLNTAIFMSALLIMSFFMEHAWELTPCILCLIQRIILAILLPILALQALSHYHHYHKTYHFLSTLHFLFLLLGLAVALHHSHLQRLASNSLHTCLPSWTMMWKYYSYDSLWKLIIKGSGGCNEIGWSYLGLSIPNWLSLAYLLLFFLWVITHFNGLTAKKHNR